LLYVYIGQVEVVDVVGWVGSEEVGAVGEGQGDRLEALE
jgi:hypothetical protein